MPNAPFFSPLDSVAAASSGLSLQEAPALDGDMPAGTTSQPGATGDPNQPAGGPPPRQGFDPFFIIIIGMTAFLVVMIFTGSRRQKREQRERQGMLDGLKRNDKVQTIGGIIGTVAEVRSDEVILKVDDAGQHKIRFARSAIQQVISSRGGPAEAEPTEEEAPTN
ncbi:MAG: preprotein translocase subunit YajC [Phycisphaerales bacterium]|jgi:preprotein translocase subunit YajC